MKKIVAISIVLFFAVSGFAQQLPWGHCGIVNVVDAAGNRIKRVYFCNNGEPYPKTVKDRDLVKQEPMQPVDELFPNPTSGKFTIRFSKSLENAIISIIDNRGKYLVQFKASGYEIELDLSPYAGGAYYLRIDENGRTITRKVLKQ